jgi:site-specific recombinase XerC
VRIGSAIDMFLRWREIERGATVRSVESYRRILAKLAQRHPQTAIGDLAGTDGTRTLRAFVEQWADRSASTRCNVISVIHSFFAWAVSEDLIESDPSACIRRPPKRKPQITRPSAEQLAKIRKAADARELPTILLLEGVGLRNSEVRACRWEHLDLVRGRVLVLRKVRTGRPSPSPAMSWRRWRNAS